MRSLELLIVVQHLLLVSVFSNSEYGGRKPPLTSLKVVPIVERSASKISLTMNEAEPKAHPRPFRIFIDVGHGGKDEGAQGLMGISEKDLSLQIGNLVKESLHRRKKNHPLEVKLSRESDTFLGLQDRVNHANVWEADIFVSIHANSSPVARAQGYEVYFLSPEATDSEAVRLANMENEIQEGVIFNSDVLSILSDVQVTQHIVQSSQVAETIFRAMQRKFPSLGRSVRQAPFTVLSGTTMPSVLVEVGYITNQTDALNLMKTSYLKRLSNAISSGIVECLLKLAPNHRIQASNEEILIHETGWEKTRPNSISEYHPSLPRSASRLLSY